MVLICATVTAEGTVLGLSPSAPICASTVSDTVSVVLLKLQLGVVSKVKELLPAAVGVPVAVSTIV